MGDAVFTSTSQRVSVCAGIGSCVLGSTWARISNEMIVCSDLTCLFLLEH